MQLPYFVVTVRNQDKQDELCFDVYSGNIFMAKEKELAQSYANNLHEETGYPYKVHEVK